MTDFFKEILDAVRLEDAMNAVSMFILEYPYPIAGVLVFLLLMLFFIRFIRNRKTRQPVRDIDSVTREADAPEIEKTTAAPTQKDPADISPDPGVPSPMGLMGRLKNGLLKTRASIAGRIDGVLSERGIADAETLEAIEETLITSDVGVNTTMALIEKIEENAASFKNAGDVRQFLKTQMLGFLTRPRQIDPSIKPYVIMVVGVNGVGKTTTIGKLASRYQSEGKKVLIGAADTFRAAAVEQLEIWAQRSGADIVRHRDNADPAAVAYDAVGAGLSRGSDIVIIDTAGRLQTKVNLMEQLKKIKRSIGKQLPDAPHEILLVLDATTGQNALSQAKTFHEGIGVTSLAMTKLDGTAKGGIVISICSEMNLPLQYIGVGEGIDDLQPFDPEAFIDAIF